MSLRPAAEAPVGAPVRLGGEPSRLHLVLRAGQAAETSGVEELAKKAAAKFDAALKVALEAAAKSRNLAVVKRMLKITSKSTIADIRTKLQPWQDWLQSQLKNDTQKEKFQRALQKLQRISTGGQPVTLPRGCDWDAYVAEKDACKGLTKAQEDLLYNKMSDQRDKENYIFSVFLYLLRVAFMLD